MESQALRFEPIPPGAAVRALARDALSARLGAVERFLSLAAEQPPRDPEHVHQLRVATRRAAAAIRLFGDLLPQRDALRMDRLLKRIRRAADPARDDDVLAARLRSNPDAPGIESLLRRSDKHRLQSQRRIGALKAELIRGGRLRTLTGRLAAALDETADAPRIIPSKPDAWLRDRLRPLARKFRRAAKRSSQSVSRQHRLRLRTKALRYAVELAAPAMGEKPVARVSTTLSELQDLLGTVNDHAVAADRFRHWLDDSDEPDERGYLRANMKAERKHLREARRTLKAWWTPRRRRRLKKQLRRLMKS